MAFKTIAAPTEFQQKVKRSIFHCYLFPIASDQEVRELISAHSHAFANATHNCWAYVYGFAQETRFCSDAGEPHGTAGKPMLTALLRAELTNVLAIVTRYYGGVKLGVPGLIEAYASTVAGAVEQAEKVEAVPQTRFKVAADYTVVESVTGLALSLRGQVLSSFWDERAELVLSVPSDQHDRMREFLDGLSRQSRLVYSQEEN